MSMSYTAQAPAHPHSHPHPQSPQSPAGRNHPYHLQNGHTPSMDNRQPEYQRQEAPPTPQYAQQQDHRGPSNFSTAATPTSEYGLPPSSARSGAFPEYIQRTPQYTPGTGPPSAGLHQPTSPSIPLQNNSITSPTYPPGASPYSPYQTQPDMSHYAGAPGVYGRPEWAAAQGHYGHGPPPMAYGHPVSSGPSSAGLVSPGHPISTVYSFVPIPGAQQHKRPRRRYEEIERMYKCGWNGCEKAYGTLNHLNAHVTMQSHGAKRTPEEFKEIRKEWKQKKKQEEQDRKADEERQRAQNDDRRQPESLNDNRFYAQN